jgi:UDP-N-acetylmuramoyl-L-alanyl-D-glutamate--2,6-diaminopimelate ligase
MRILNDILSNINDYQLIGSKDKLINKICFDSREVEKNDLFVAVSGTNVDGHNYIETAIEKGATAICLENLPEKQNADITYIKVNDSKSVLAEMVSNFYDNPSSKLKLVGITGTNGKTTTATLLYQLFKNLGYKVGLVSTIRYLIHDKEIKATHTTPDAIKLNALFNEMVNEGCEYCFMEVSSHAIDQGRIHGISFMGAVFTNITHDHLDYHSTFKNYIDAKKLFFDNLDNSAFALTNRDDKNGAIMLQNTKANKYNYSIKSVADFHLKILEQHFEGTLLNIDNTELWASFIGQFNAYNILSVYAVAILLEQNKVEVLTQLSKLNHVEGRFETIRSKNGITAIVDYAHTPDALKNVLSTIDEIRKGEEKLLVVVGAGGNRDKTKRPEMGQIVSNYADKIILTSDNPRSEDPNDIIAEIKEGIIREKRNQVISITNREEAIRTAIHLAQSNDIVLVAGKGHETYQEINGVKSDFDDREIIKAIFKEQ